MLHVGMRLCLNIHIRYCFLNFRVWRFRASELLLSIPEERRRKVKQRSPELSLEEQDEAALEENELDLLEAGRSLGDAKEFMRASHLLGDCESARGRFMRWYYDFLVRELLLVLSSTIKSRFVFEGGRETRTQRLA